MCTMQTPRPPPIAPTAGIDNDAPPTSTGCLIGSQSEIDHHIPPPPLQSPGTSRAHLPPGGCGRGPRPMLETPPSELRAWEGTDTGQLWAVAHRTTSWASGHTTTDPQETPGRPGSPKARHTRDTLSTGRQAWCDTPAEVAEEQVRMLQGARAYNLLSWVILDFPMSILAVAYIHVAGTSFPLFFVLEVHFDLWGLHACHAATLPRAGPISL